MHALIAQIDLDKVLAPAFGGVLLVSGLVAMAMHVRAHRRQLADPDADEADQIHYRGRYRRRMQVSGLICLVGVMIAAGDALVPWEKAPQLFAVYWLVVLGVALWMLMLALADMYATSAHTKAAIARIRAQQRILEQQLADARREGLHGNGHADASG